MVFRSPYGIGLLVALFVSLMSFSLSVGGAQAQDYPLPPDVATANDTADIQSPPEDTASKETNDIVPVRLSLADIEKITGERGTKNILGTGDLPSPLESLYQARVVDDLALYGYDLFQKSKDAAADTPPPGRVQDDYILSAGDTLDVIFRGQDNTRGSYTIDTQGLLVIDNFIPVTAAGRSLKDVREELIRLTQDMHNTEIFLSLSGVRQIGVLVAGNVTAPGRQNLTSFHSVLDALNAAGGVEKTGSLRDIKLVRGGKTYPIDLYAVMMSGGGQADKLLADGDRIIVPPVGPTVAIAGAVKRPAIYEIKKGERLTLLEMLGLAGGVLSPGNNRFVKLELTGEGEETVADIDMHQSRLFGDGSILSVAQAIPERKDEVTLKGETRQAGAHDLKKSKTLSELIKNRKTLGEDIYPLIGMIERKDKDTLARQMIEFSPIQVLHGQFNRTLEDGDIVYLFSSKDISILSRSNAGENDSVLKKASYAANSKLDDPFVSSFLSERAAFVRGAVRMTGAYPVAAGTNLESLLSVAGGLTVEGDAGRIELTSRYQGTGAQADGKSGTLRSLINLVQDNPRDVAIGPGDTVRVGQRFTRVADQSVSIMGEVAHPGKYDLMAGDTLSALLSRAGGITPQGYADGIIFSRASERERELSRYRAQAQDLEMKLAASLESEDKDKRPDAAKVSAAQGLIAQLKEAKAVGRITVEGDPGVLAADPEQDILLEAGDKIYIPKRPLSVRVAGEVLSPAALQFRKGKSATDYINEAGGTTYYADSDRTFVVYPDGSAKPMSTSAWNHSASFIPPGSTVIVPRDPEPFDFMEGAERISQILANLAISGLYVDAIGNDN